MGYYRAGFDVVGVDIKPQPNYPFEFVQADALEYCTAHGREFDAIHASPPCQAYTRAKHLRGREHPKMVGDTRIILNNTCRPWVIENVIGAPMANSIVLCGTQFGLLVYRHRLFESNYLLLCSKCNHPTFLMPGYVCIYGDVVRGRQTGSYGNKYQRYTTAYARSAMGIDWMTGRELSQAIPPAYTEFIGRQLMSVIAGGPHVD